MCGKNTNLVDSQGKTAAKNIMFNFIGQFIPLFFAIFTVPCVLKGLGIERYGLLALVGVIGGYFVAFDFGVSKATTKFIAEELGRGHTDKIKEIVRTSLLIVMFLAMVGTVIFIRAVPFLVTHLLNMPLALLEEAKSVFYLVSAFLAINLMVSVLRAILEAYRKFKLIYKIDVPANVSFLLIPTSAFFFKTSLFYIVFFLLISSFLTLLVYFFVVKRTLSLSMSFLSPAYLFRIDRKLLISLLKYGGWLSGLTVINILILNMDRMFIGSLVSLSAVSFFAIPYMLVNKLCIIPRSFKLTLFPTASMMEVQNKKEMHRLFINASKYLVLITGIFTVIILLFAGDILSIWVGNDFARQSVDVLRILAVGFFLNAQIWVPTSFILGIGRADIITKIFLGILPLYMILLWLLTVKMGIVGTAVAWAIRAGIEIIAVHIAAWKFVIRGEVRFFKNEIAKIILIFSCVVFILFYITFKVKLYFSVQILIAIISFIVFSVLAWLHVFNLEEKKCITGYFYKNLNRV